jgi:hypothetical protein
VKNLNHFSAFPATLVQWHLIRYTEVVTEKRECLFPHLWGYNEVGLLMWYTRPVAYPRFVVTVGEGRVLSSVLTWRTTETTSSSKTTDGEDGDIEHELNNHFFVWVYGSDPAGSILRFIGSSLYFKEFLQLYEELRR